jgi:hypothetical protein
MAIQDDLVPNPRHAELQLAIAKVRERAHVVETALDPACALFGGQAVWVGPTARGFGQELTGRRARLKTAIQHVVAELEAELRGTPARVSPAAAGVRG